MPSTAVGARERRPEGRRIPLCQRSLRYEDRKHPTHFRHLTKSMPRLWKEEGNRDRIKVRDQLLHTIWANVPNIRSEQGAQAVKTTRAIFQEYLRDRYLHDGRVIRDVLKNKDKLWTTELLAGTGCCLADLSERQRSEDPRSIGMDPQDARLDEEVWDLHLFDFDDYANTAVRFEDGWWVRFHGTSFYGAFGALGLHYVCPSEGPDPDVDPKLEAQGYEKRGHAAASGRGIYTSRQWGTSMHYAHMHVLPGAPLGTRVILLVATPGDASEGGVATWTTNPYRKKSKRLEEARAASTDPPGGRRQRRGGERGCHGPSQEEEDAEVWGARGWLDEHNRR